MIRAPGNVGYARAANLGIAATRADVVAVLNADTRLEPGAAGALVDRSTPTRGSPRVGPRLKNLDGTDYPSARRLPSVFVAVMHGAARACGGRRTRSRRSTGRLDAAPDEPRVVDWVSGAAVWLRRDALDEVGGWDERYFMYLEDVDLCWRLRGAGWEIAYEPAGVVVPRAGREHRPAPVPDARRAPPLGVAFRPPPVHRRACAPAAVRGRVPGRARRPGDGRARLARAENRRVHRLAWHAYGQGLSDEATRQRPVRARKSRGNLGW